MRLHQLVGGGVACVAEAKRGGTSYPTTNQLC